MLARQKFLPLTLIILLVFSANAFCDGGTLRFEPLELEFEPVFWPLQDFPIFRPRFASMKLDRTEPEPVSIWDTHSVSFVIPRTGTPRLFVDSNRDGEFSSQEIYELTEDGPYRKIYHNVSIPIRKGDFQQTVEVEVTVGVLPGWLHVAQCHSCYVGDLSVDGEQWPARIEFRALNPESGDAQAIMIIDSDRDGVFDPFVDPWLADRGVGYWNGQLRQVDTVYSATEAVVSIQPYTGPVATLKIEGEGFYRLHLQRRGMQEASSNDSSESYWFCVPRQKEAEYMIPPGHYLYDSAWLMPEIKGMENVAFELYDFPPNELSAINFQLKQGETQVVPYGGPLAHTIEVKPHPLWRLVFLDYKGLCNAAGFAYLQTDFQRENGRGRSPAPCYEIQDDNGKTIETGQFEFG